MAVMSVVPDAAADGQYRSRRYSTPGLNAAHPRAQSTDNLDDVGLYHQLICDGSYSQHQSALLW